MLLGFVLLGRSLEEKARISASSDMNELIVSFLSFKSRSYALQIFWHSYVTVGLNVILLFVYSFVISNQKNDYAKLSQFAQYVSYLKKLGRTKLYFMHNHH